MSDRLTNLLFKDYRRKVLSLLLLHPEEKYHVRAIARLTNTVAGTLHKELSRLADAELLLKQKVGNQTFYRANVDCDIFEDLASLLKTLASTRENNGKMDVLIEKNREAILNLAKVNGITNVRVFGSMARNEAGPNSDLDLLVNVEPGYSGFALGGFLSDITELVQRKVDVVTEQSLHPKIREKVLAAARTL